jgi:ankyrin repeat protein
MLYDPSRWNEARLALERFLDRRGRKGNYYPLRASTPTRTSPFVSLTASVMIASFVLSPACSSPAAKAKDELARKAFPFSASAFLERVRAGDVETVQLFLSAGMSPNAAERGYTALLEAARRGHGAVVLELAKAGADIEAKDPYGVTALMVSFITGSGDAALKLMEMGADVNARDVDGRTALIEALTTENDIPQEAIRTLIRKGADVNVRIAGGITPLMIAVYDDPAIVRMLVKAGADVNARDDRGASALRMAKDNPENVKILKEAGAAE